MTLEEIKKAIWVFDEGAKPIAECNRDELLSIIGHQFDTIMMTRETLDKTFKLLGAGRS